MLQLWTLSASFLFVCHAGASLAATAQDLGTLGGSYSFARDINRSAIVIGEAETEAGQIHAFRWALGQMQDLGARGTDRYSMANGLNDQGQIVGYSRPDEGRGHAVAILWSDAQVIALPSLAGMPDAQASDLNNAEVIVGVSGTKAVVWKKRKPKALKSLGGDYSIALAINDQGAIIGNSQNREGELHATLWTATGDPIDLGTLGGRFSTANGINELGHIVGSSEDANGDIHAFLWKEGRMHDLGPGMIRGINAAEVYVGESSVADGTHSVLWSNELELSALGSLPSSVYSSAFAINNDGIVVGISQIPSSPGGFGSFRATLWVP